jgi:hypothetical protein
MKENNSKISVNVEIRFLVHFILNFIFCHTHTHTHRVDDEDGRKEKVFVIIKLRGIMSQREKE